MDQIFSLNFILTLYELPLAELLNVVPVPFQFSVNLVEAMTGYFGQPWKPKLRIFIAGRNRQEVGGSEALASAFAKLRSLEEVTLHQNGITWKGAVALRDSW